MFCIYIYIAIKPVFSWLKWLNRCWVFIPILYIYILSVLTVKLPFWQLKLPTFLGFFEAEDARADGQRLPEVGLRTGDDGSGGDEMVTLWSTHQKLWNITMFNG